MAAPFVATSRLNNIIQMITLSRQSGILRVLRGRGATRELGQIRFVNGEPVAALLGQMTGAGALNALSNWGECQYAFDESVGGDMSAQMDPSRAYRQGASPTGSLSSMPNPSAASWPTYGYQQQSGPLGPAFPLSGESSPFAGSGPQAPGQGYPSWATSSSPANYPPAYVPSQTRPALGYSGGGQAPAGAPGFQGGSQGAPGWGQPAPAAPASLLPEQMGVVPQRTTVSEQIDQLPLDRRERMVLLLVDGQRTLTDLARLTRRNEQEVYGVLAHLALLGLVWIGG